MSVHEDLRARWTPSPEQDQAAAEAIRQHAARLAAGEVIDNGERGVYTVHLLINKRSGWWTRDVEVVPLSGVFWSREAALGACLGAAAAYHLLRPDVPLVAGWAWHSELSDPADPWRTPGRTWATRWAVWEDPLSERGGGRE